MANRASEESYAQEYNARIDKPYNPHYTPKASTSGCFHQLVWFFEKPYRYRCLKCWQKLKICSGNLLPDAKQKEWFNAHAEKWPWEQEPVQGT